ncbi:hypothetical protein D3C84_657950 [compost metagenome]
MQRRYHLNPGRLVEAGEVDHADGAGEDITQAHADQHRDIDPEAAHEAVDQEDGRQHQAGDDQVDRGAEGFGTGAATGPVNGNRKQRKTNRGDDRAGHQRWEETHHLGHERGDQHAEETGGNGRTENTLQADAGHSGHGHHAANCSKACTHHYRHADADCANAERLDDGGDTSDQQVGIDQESDFFTRKAGGLADDQRHGNRASVHQQDML